MHSILNNIQYNQEHSFGYNIQKGAGRVSIWFVDIQIFYQNVLHLFKMYFKFMIFNKKSKTNLICNKKLFSSQNSPV